MYDTLGCKKVLFAYIRWIYPHAIALSYFPDLCTVLNFLFLGIFYVTMYFILFRSESDICLVYPYAQSNENIYRWSGTHPGKHIKFAEVCLSSDENVDWGGKTASECVLCFAWQLDTLCNTVPNDHLVTGKRFPHYSPLWWESGHWWILLTKG